MPMIALLADIHGNREALSACLADAARRKAERYVFLGDLVGYGADPGWVVDRVMDYVGRGALAILGNHDAAAAGAPVSMGETAARAIVWTRQQLNAAQRDFLEKLPLSIEDGARYYVHASADEPAQWHYILGAQRARKSLDATESQQTFCGHVHLSALYHLSRAGKLSEFKPADDVAIPLSPGRRWLAVIGAVGQPRDRNAAACYGLLDETQNTLTYIRVPYDVVSAARKIREAGLPAVLAARLEQGY
jgi:diadenosine tetraphosphatase ApaH/serine/threonine PP2A family protein phosphatase